MTKKQKAMLSRIIAAFIIYITLAVTDHMEILPEGLGLWGKMALYLVPYVLIGWDIVYKAFRNIRNGQVFDENFLMTVATFGAFGVGEYSEAVAVMLFYQVGELFQSYAVNRSRQSITELMDICPEYANIEEDGQLKQVDPDDVQVGDIIVVKAGERIPLDGKVVFGNSMVDTSALTGESVPRKVAEGDDIISGCVNGSGLLRVQVTKEFDDSTVAKILELVENASSKKAHVENFITRFARYYTPLVVMGAVLLAVIPPLFFGQSWSEGIRRACTFLVISCPCALVISVPMSFFSGIGAASKKGVLIKGSNYLEALSEMDTIVFDKTGTLTHACPRVVRVIPFRGKDEAEMLRLAACLEEHFPHSMANAVVEEAKRRGLSHEERHAKVEYLVAHGIASSVDGAQVCIGSAHFIFEDEKCVIPEGEENKFDALPPEFSQLYLAIDGVLSAVICISDPLREEAREVLSALRNLGVKNLVMLTGDSPRTAASIAEQLGVDDFRAGVLPADKAEYVAAMRREGHTVLMVGDGINDSPALSEADSGIAISDGAAIAREIADITIAADSLWELVRLRQLAMGLMCRIQNNYRFVIGFNGALIGLGVAGILPPTTSAMLHNLSTLGVSLHSMTALPQPKQNKVS